MKFLITCISCIAAILAAPYIQEALLNYVIGGFSVIITDPAEIFRFRIIFAFFFSICILLLVTSFLYLKYFSPKSRILIPLIPMLLVSTVCTVIRKRQIESYAVFFGYNFNDLKLYYIPLFGAVSGFLMILTFFFVKHRRADTE